MKKIYVCPQKKTSWLILTCFFIFDNFVSYYAITKMNAKEANLFVAPFVEKYPLLYFLCIPATVLIIFVIVKLITKITLKLMRLTIANPDKKYRYMKSIKLNPSEAESEGGKKWKIEEKVLEKSVLFSVVIYWGLGNSLPNLLFLLGFLLSFQTVWLINNLALLPALIYCSMTIKSLSNKDKN